MPRHTEWWNKIINVEALAAGATTAIALDNGEAGADTKSGLTLIRSIIELWYSTPTTGALGKLSFGLTMVSEDEAAGAAYPDPDREGFQDTRWWFLLPEVFMFYSSGHGRYAEHVGPYDIHAMRKWPTPLHTAMALVHNNDTTNTLDVNGYVRTLVKRR